MQRTKFYARTWILWAGCFLSGFFGGVIALALLLDSDIDNPIPLIITFICILSVFIGFAFRLSTLQKPIFLIRKEGIEQRIIGVPFFSLIGGPALALFPFELTWRLLTRKFFQVRVVRIRWDEIDTIVLRSGHLNINGLVVEEDGTRINENPFDFKADAFGVSIIKVEIALQYYRNNISDRENLTSWNDTGEVFEIIE